MSSPRTPRAVTSSNTSRLIDIHVEPREQSDTLAPGVPASSVTVRVTCRHVVARGAIYVLSLATLAPGAADYLEQTVAQGIEEYYLGVKEAPGQWLGRGAELLGLDGEVDGEAFRRVLAHADPSTGRKLTDGRSDPKVVGIDATFCAPKSVSLLYALGAR